MESLADTHESRTSSPCCMRTEEQGVSRFPILAKRGICMLLVHPFRPPCCTTIEQTSVCVCWRESVLFLIYSDKCGCGRDSAVRPSQEPRILLTPALWAINLPHFLPPRPLLQPPTPGPSMFTAPPPSPLPLLRPSSSCHRRHPHRHAPWPHCGAHTSGSCPWPSWAEARRSRP